MAKRKPRPQPKIGTECTRQHKGNTFTMTVVSTEAGVGYRVGRKTFSTPTAAAKFITKTEVNGWVFWGLDG